MAFGSTFTLVVNGENKVMNRINQDNYGSEYLLRVPTEEYRMKIRHSKEAAPKGVGIQYERHNVELTRRIFATSSTLERVLVQSSTIRVPSDEDLTWATKISKGFGDILANNTVIGDLYGWLS